jgi:hypothetical protein
LIGGARHPIIIASMTVNKRSLREAEEADLED